MAMCHERNQCPLALLITFLALGVTAGVIAFIVASPCRDDWPVDEITTNATEEYTDTTVGSVRVESRRPRPPFRLMEDSVLRRHDPHNRIPVF